MSENKSSASKDSPEKSGSYHTMEEMPTVSTLLDRRKLLISGGSPEKRSESTSPEGPKIKSAPRGNDRRQSQRLELWTPEILARPGVAEFQAIEMLFSNQADWSLLFLKREDGNDFDARAVSGASRDRWAIWTGLCLSQSSMPEVWKDLSRADALSLRASEPKQAALRAALGILPDESTWLFWVGPRDTPLGILLTGGMKASLGMEVVRKVVALLRG
ncbi:MAG: hypothetical protein KGQ59_12235 [Bdellovibrionales bacterium]|nr:hypothetical protein [Bdellovibrionales bacterium]